MFSYIRIWFWFLFHSDRDVSALLFPAIAILRRTFTGYPLAPNIPRGDAVPAPSRFVDNFVTLHYTNRRIFVVPGFQNRRISRSIPGFEHGTSSTFPLVEIRRFVDFWGIIDESLEASRSPVFTDFLDCFCHLGLLCRFVDSFSVIPQPSDSPVWKIRMSSTAGSDL